jgi:hypothetical protein
MMSELIYWGISFGLLLIMFVACDPGDYNKEHDDVWRER